jgi:hypothetical protein
MAPEWDRKLRSPRFRYGVSGTIAAIVPNALTGHNQNIFTVSIPS